MVAPRIADLWSLPVFFPSDPHLYQILHQRFPSVLIFFYDCIN